MSKFVRIAANCYQVVNDGTTVDELPLGCYHLVESKGIVYIKTTESSLVEDKLYGEKAESHISDFVGYYGAVRKNRCAGVLFEGPKGTGKSATALNTARRLANEYKVPLFQVADADVIPALSGFLSEFARECVVYVDEFDKYVDRFEHTREQDNYVNCLLSLMDGGGHKGVAFIFTVNDNKPYLRYFQSRPGRIRYWHLYDRLDSSIITDYVQSHLADPAKAPGLFNMIRHLELQSIDIVTALVDEANRTGRNATAMAKYMNVGRLKSPEYSASFYQNGRFLKPTGGDAGVNKVKLFESNTHLSVVKLAFDRNLCAFVELTKEMEALWDKMRFNEQHLYNRHHVGVLSPETLVAMIQRLLCGMPVNYETELLEDLMFAPVNDSSEKPSRGLSGSFTPTMQSFARKPPVRAMATDKPGIIAMDITDADMRAVGWQSEGPDDGRLNSIPPGVILGRAPTLTPPAPQGRPLAQGEYTNAAMKKPKQRSSFEIAEDLARQWVETTLLAKQGKAKLSVPKKAKSYQLGAWMNLPWIPVIVSFNYALADKIGEDPVSGEMRFQTNYPDIIAVTTPTEIKPISFTFD